MQPISTPPPSTVKYTSTSQATTHEPQMTTLTSSNNTKKPASLWHKLGQEFDVHNMSRQQSKDLSSKLYEGGEISLLDHAILSFDDSHLPFGSIFKTEANQNGNHDLIAEFKARTEDPNTDNKSRLNNEHVLNLLERLDHAKAGPISIDA